MVVEEKKRIMITLSIEVLAKLEAAAKEAGITKSAMASVAVTEYLRNRI